jgi:hypothetical protein
MHTQQPPRSYLQWLADEAGAPPSTYEEDPADMGTAYGLDCSLADRVHEAIDDGEWDTLDRD